MKFAGTLRWQAPRAWKLAGPGTARITRDLKFAGTFQAPCGHFAGTLRANQPDAGRIRVTGADWTRACVAPDRRGRTGPAVCGNGSHGMNLKRAASKLQARSAAASGSGSESDVA